MQNLITPYLRFVAGNGLYVGHVVSQRALNILLFSMPMERGDGCP